MNFNNTNTSAKNKALFLDRDGVVNINYDYVYKIDEFDFIPEVFEVCHAAINNGYQIFIVTNQSGIGRGFYSEEDFGMLTQWMIAEFLARGIKIQKVYFCPHHPTQAQGVYLKNCDCRKPKAGMLLAAMNEFAIDPAQSLMLGDSQTDMQAAAAAGVKAVFIQSPADYHAAIAAL
ncbi:MAG: D-glycero-beta-D-manno-heptose 1,7-bisphosphate 7-phosphatase [Marinagarivorans sp.]|nr:D-glycero-beta-D-manno-heptose 1,7-bisphosphate 7-phosphatase [Marinagarivorans sp.]